MSEATSATGLLARATREYGVGNMQAAGQLVADAERLAPTLAPLLELKGAIELAHGNPTGAAAALAQAVAAAESSMWSVEPGLRIALATACEQAGQIDQAIAGRTTTR